MSLVERATRFNRMILDDAMDEYGIIRHHLAADRTPITAAMLDDVRQDTAWRKAKGLKWHPLAGTPGYAMYEDANYVGNRYLMAAVWQWLATHEPAAKEDARRAYEATMIAYDEGAKKEKGYWPKPYGALKGEYAIDRNYTETSVDQAYTPVLALWRYYQHLADAPAKQRIGEALQAHGHWWIRHNYTYDYLGEVWKVFGERITSPSALKIPIGMHIAYQVTGDVQLWDECVRVLRKARQDGALKMHRGPRGEIKELYHWAEIYHYFLRETELAGEAEWERLIRECWRAAKSTIQPDGLCIGMGDFRPDGTIAAYNPPGFIDDVHHGYWKTNASHPASTAQMACLAMLVYELGYDEDAGAIGVRLLENVTEAHTMDVKGYAFASPEQMSPEMRENPPPPLFNTRTVVFWLEAYWRGRLRGVL